MTEFPNWFEGIQANFDWLVPRHPLRVLQIGVYTGDATMWLLANRDVQLMHDVDTWLGGGVNAPYETIDFSAVEAYYDSRIEGHGNVEKFKMTSDQYFAEEREIEPHFNFVYIDGDHSARQTALDALNAWPLLDVGGIMAFDDYLWTSGVDGWHEPKRGIEAVLHLCAGRYQMLCENYQIWILKTA